MPYVTSIERLAKEEGRVEGVQLGALQDAREMVQEALDARFKSVPEDISLALRAIESRDTLKSLLRQAITCRSIAAFRKALEKSRG